MTAAAAATLVSAILGVAGTLVLFFSTWGFEPLEGAPFYSDAMREWNARVKARNKARKLAQRLGLALLCASFAVQAVAVFLP